MTWSCWAVQAHCIQVVRRAVLGDIVTCVVTHANAACAAVAVLLIALQALARGGLGHTAVGAVSC